MKSTQIHLESFAGCRITIQAASLHACLLQGAESPSKLPASMPAGFQAQSSEWRFQDCKVSLGPRLPCNPVPQAGKLSPPQNTPKSMKSIQIHLESPAACRLTIQAASLHTWLLQGAESASKLPASLPAGFQAQLSEWRF